MADDASLEDFLDADDQEADNDEPETTEGDEQATDRVGEAVEPDTANAESSEDSDGDGQPGETVAPIESDDATADDGTESADGVTAAQTPDPAVATYDWTPGGAACAACGETVERRWRDGPGFVCGECKDW